MEYAAQLVLIVALLFVGGMLAVWLSLAASAVVGASAGWVPAGPVGWSGLLVLLAGAGMVLLHWQAGPVLFPLGVCMVTLALARVFADDGVVGLTVALLVAALLSGESSVHHALALWSIYRP